MSKKTTQFGIIRHARTSWNAARRIQGNHDIELSEPGRQMAANWGSQLQTFHWDRILSSDLKRCRQTAELVNRELQVPVDHDPRLREQDWGQWSGLTITDLYAQHREAVRLQEQAGWDFVPPQGESRHLVLDRTLQCLEEARQKHPGQSLLVICHQGVIKCLLYHLEGRRFLPEEPPLLHKGYHLHLVESRSEGQQLTGLNHLLLES